MSDIEGELESSACVCLKQRLKVWVTATIFPSLSSFWGQSRLYLLTGLELWDSYLEKPIMVWGDNTPHSHMQTHTNTETVTTSQVIGIRLFQCYQTRMRWCCGFLTYLSGQVFSSLYKWCRQLPNSSPKCNKINYLICPLQSWSHTEEKESGSQMKGMQRKGGEGQRLHVSK